MIEESWWQRERHRVEGNLEALQVALFVTMILAFAGSWVWVALAFLSDGLTALQALLAYCGIVALAFLALTPGEGRGLRSAIAVGGLLLFVVAYMMRATGDPALGLVFSLAIFFAGAALGPLGAILAALLAGLLQAVLPVSPEAARSSYLALSLASNALAAVMASLVSAGQRDALDTATHAVQESRALLAELRVSRGELGQTVRMLDLANERLQRANSELRLSREMAEGARRFKNELAARVSHELRTPLNLILGFSETIAFCPEAYGEPLPAPYRRDVLDIHRVGRHLLSLIEDILDLARLESGRLGLYRQQADLPALIQEAAEIVSPLLQRKRLTFATRIPSSVSPVDIDVARIRQVLLNLLSNAARFTSEGGITVGLCQGDTEIEVSVADTGPGIAAKDLSKAFEAYQQVAESPRDHQEGVGLGLAISKELVELHGGRMWADSVPGKGSTFYFTLPTRGGPAISYLVPTGEVRYGNPSLPTVPFMSDRAPEVIGMLRRHLPNCHLVVAKEGEDLAARARAENARAIVFDGGVQQLPPLALPIPLIACPLGAPGGHTPLSPGVVTLPKPISLAALDRALRSAPPAVQHVLLVSEYAEFLRLLARMLSARYGGATAIHQAMDRPAAFARMQALQPEVVLVDWDVTQEEIGADTIDELRTVAPPDTLFVAVTWSLDDAGRTDAGRTDAGRDDAGRDDAPRDQAPLTIRPGERFTLDDYLRYLRAILEVTYPVGESEGK